MAASLLMLPASAATIAPGAQSLQSVNFPTRSIAHASGLGALPMVSATSTEQAKADATLTVTPGLANGPPECVSFQAANGMWLRHKDYRIRLAQNDGSETFRGDATFCVRDGATAGTVRLESYNYPGRFIRHRDYQLWVDTHSNAAPFPSDSSFKVIAPWSPSARKNPAIKGLFGDPNIVNFDGRYYVYPTSDGYAGWSGTQFRTFSSLDLVNWTDHGNILSLGVDVTWATGRAWAPTIARKNGRYYFYFCADTNIGVASSASPTGPFTDALGRPLVAAGFRSGQMIDPHVFTASDGSSYLLWGNGGAYGVQLNDDMVSFSGTVQTFSLPNFREGLFMHERAGTYYLSYSVDDTRSENYHVDYATGPSPLGPWTYRGTLLQKDLALGVKGPGHHSIVQQPGTDNWFIAYHRFAVPLGDGTNREVAIDRLVHNGDGTLQRVVVTP
ncbi:family 43 glycosylhydrolase [Rhizobacter sp. Root1221]|uniref:family 43 glycosylhydrolase n=1 Tax=Rhizobacter sp. Root1221 TaxID=1736433 RepID=UPI0006F367E1|nr:family 43 glycosylhydrolase [Rhizobacter sp. Root1221]KQV95817.1 hypothetical protein ASC87_04540 [Rhizobacter sp. Root1221]